MSKPLRGEIPLAQIEHWYQECRESHLKERLLAMKKLYSGWKATEVAQHLQVSYKTIYNWIERWNEGGVEGLRSKKRGKGREAYLSKEDWKKVVEEVEDKGYNLEKIREYVAKTREVSYSYQGVWNILRRVMKVPYGKPYVCPEKQPETAEEELKKN